MSAFASYTCSRHVSLRALRAIAGSVLSKKYSTAIRPDGEIYDVAVLGGGIVGVTTAREIKKKYPNKTITIIEKESEVGGHQTNHNSGVIHAGIYYKPGSSIARCCVRGLDLMYEYCAKHNIPAKRVGKLIAAVDENEHKVLLDLIKNGQENGVKGLEIFYREQVKAKEPYVDVYSALWSPNTGVVDFAQVTRHIASALANNGEVDVRLQFEVKSMQKKVDAHGDVLVEIQGLEQRQLGPVKTVRARHAISCCGLQSDLVGRLGGGAVLPKIVNFRGRYWQMKAEYKDIVTANVYPAPKVGAGIAVGVHFTPTVNERRGEQMIVGPGSSICLDREAYKASDFSVKELMRLTGNVGAMKFVASNLGLSISEAYRDLSKTAFLNEARKLIPTITDDMVEESFVGVMGTAFSHIDGKVINEFEFDRKAMDGLVLHVRNTPSPACTASFALAEDIASTAAADFAWE